MANFGATRADKVSKAWKELLAYRAKFGFPEFDRPDDVSDNWHVSHGMPHNVVRAVRSYAETVYDGMGRMPWSQAPKGGSK